MVSRVEVARVVLWGHTIGAVAWDDARRLATFEYARDFQRSGIEVAPLTMPLGPRLYGFPDLPRESFLGLPGLLADSLPDRFGNAVIDRWLVRQGRDRAGFSPIERLCYIGRRGMGALEFHPAVPGHDASVPLQLELLVELAGQVLGERAGLQVELRGDDGDADALNEILRVSSSAGGARAKAVVAWNRETGELRSGQVQAPPGFESWLLKFDGVQNRDKELNDPAGFGRIEYAYYRMALAAGIEMNESRLLHESGRSHFMTRRFDRTDDGEKVHVQSLFAMAHLDFNQAGAHGYEQAFEVMQRLEMPMPALSEQFRRMVFNVVLRNQDDHTKNICFLMDKAGRWTLSPAFDLVYSYNPRGAWTGRHQMTINGKRDAFTRDDLAALAERFRIPRRDRAIGGVLDVARRWPEFAEEAGVPGDTARLIGAAHRLDLGP